MIASGDARAVRGDVTVTADQLIAYYRKKAHRARRAPAPRAPAATGGADRRADTGGNEIYRLEAEGNVQIFTPTDQARGDHAVYDIDQAVLVMTGHDLKLTTPQRRADRARHPGILVAEAHGGGARQRRGGHQATAAGSPPTCWSPTPSDTDSAAEPRRDRPREPGAGAGAGAAPPAIRWPPPASSSESRRSATSRSAPPTDIVTGDRGVYVPDTGIARIVGHVRITRGENQMNGAGGGREHEDRHRATSSPTPAGGCRA